VTLATSVRKEQLRLLWKTEYDRRFEEWAESPLGREILTETARRALALRERGIRHWGIRAIWESIRFDWTIRGRDGDGFKVNDHYHSRAARLLMARHPELKGMFELRTLKT
jgi:hypothetical protein